MKLPTIKTSTWVIALLILGLLVTGYLYNEALKEAKRQASNVENLVKEKDRELNLTRDEFRKAETDWKEKIDSLIKANKIKLPQVVAATVINTQYRDTGSVKVVYKYIHEVNDSNEVAYQIGVSYSDNCWGMKGTIFSRDKDSRLEITERQADNSVQLLVTRKRVLGFLWWKKKQEFKAYSDCGEVDVTKIEFK